MTEIPLGHYSGRMNSEFHQLSEKIDQLAELAQALRRENAKLRRDAAALVAENAELSNRIQAAHQRMSALLEKLPVAEQDQEAA